MADGELCKNCGRQETDHTYREHAEFPRKRVRGYRISVWSCPRFRTDADIEEDPERVAFELQAMETRGAGRAAWGLWAAAARNVQFKKEVAEFDKRIRQADSPQKKESARASKVRFLRECSNANHLVIV